MLNTTTRITDSRLEPSDDTKMIVTVTNTSSTATAKDVSATAALSGVCTTGVALVPRQLDFGSIPPRGKVVRELCINTECARPATYSVAFNLNYRSEAVVRECDQTRFQVVPD